MTSIENNIEEKIEDSKRMGRPPTYKTKEERRLANNRITKECMKKKPFHCSVCDKTYHAASKSKHLKTKTHQQMLIIANI